MGDPFSDFFKLIGSCFEMIGMLFMMLIDLQNTLMCPFKIWNNIGKCLGYWAMDVIINIIYFIVFWILYIFLYVPIWIGSFVLCLFLRNTSESFCFDVSYEDIIPSKDSMCFPFEYIYNYFTEGRLIYRNGEDIGNCYCIEPLIFAFRPYQTYSDFSSSGSLNVGSSMYVLIAVCLLTAVYLTNIKK